MNDWDSAITLFLNSFARRWWALDEIVNFGVTNNNLLKGDVFLVIFFLLWFQLNKSPDEAKVTLKRHILLYTLLVCVPGLVLVRALAWCLPFRVRPIDNPILHLRLAYGLDVQGLVHWSSFPSDHAFLFFLLATGMFFVNRWAGSILYFYALFFICVPRIYLGLHYPSDIIVGALLGTGLGYSAKISSLRSLIVGPFWRLQESNPGLFYGFFFLMAEETAQLYDSLRATGIGITKLIYAIGHAVKH